MILCLPRPADDTLGIFVAEWGARRG